MDEKEINFDLDQDCLWLHRIRNLLLAESSVDVVYIACFLVGTTVQVFRLDGCLKAFLKSLLFLESVVQGRRFVKLSSS